MKQIISIIFITLFLICACKDQALNPEIDKDLNQPEGQMKISLDMTNAPLEVVRLTGILANNNEEIRFDFILNDNNAIALVENLSSGNWTLTVNAFNANNEIIYSGTTEVTVYPGLVTPVSIHLNAATGGLEITVTWGGSFVYIPDKNFQNALIQEGVDKNGDGQISNLEAESVTTLHIPFKNISDMRGIESFINLEVLDCSFNSFSSIDVSNNKELVYLDCSESNLTGLDVTNNVKLQHLDCSDYRIPELNVTNNPDLIYLNCHNNLLTELNLTNNTKLEVLWCQENQLTELDISNCKSLIEISLHSIPTLYKVCVWTTPFPPSGVYVDTWGSPNIYYTTNCSP